MNTINVPHMQESKRIDAKLRPIIVALVASVIATAFALYFSWFTQQEISSWYYVGMSVVGVLMATGMFMSYRAHRIDKAANAYVTDQVFSITGAVPMNEKLSVSAMGSRVYTIMMKGSDGTASRWLFASDNQETVTFGQVSP